MRLLSRMSLCGSGVAILNVGRVGKAWTWYVDGSVK